MALQRDYIIPHTSLTISDAYHIVSDVEIKKRTQDDPGPVEQDHKPNIAPPIYAEVPEGRAMTEEEKNAQHPLNAVPTGSYDGPIGDPVYWQSGYTSQIKIEVYASKEARDSGKTPIAKLGVGSTIIDEHLATKGMDSKIMFHTSTIDENSILAQAYTYLKSTDYYSGSIDI